MMLGAGVGATIGQWGNEDPTNRLAGAAKGAFFGAAIAGIPMAARGAWKANKWAGYRGALRAGARPRNMKKFIGPMTEGQFETGAREAALGYSPGAYAMRGGLYSGGKGGGAAFRGGRFAFEHPFLVGGGIAAGYGALSIAHNKQPLASPTLEGAEVNTRYDEQAIAAEMMRTGPAPTGMVGPSASMMGPYHRAMQGSTAGLVQGLHRGRHS